MKLKNLFAIAVLTVVSVSACEKESNRTTLRIRMTDAPTALDEVNIDLKEVNVKFANDTSSWINMDTRAGIYNLLSLQNGIDTLIASGTYPSGNVKEIRLVVGDQNTVVENGQSYPLTIPSGASSGLKIKVNKDLQEGLDSLLIDFDAALSVQKEAEGFKLRPVIKLK
ncbi:MAG TPA: DUF4382 domain-containing protein [Flavisolibacter sp.]|jgi:hypothetical protein|nr:DUF4382 domain-containing protein [Flavisolibacter sp.]